MTQIYEIVGFIKNLKVGIMDKFIKTTKVIGIFFTTNSQILEVAIQKSIYPAWWPDMFMVKKYTNYGIFYGSGL